MSLFLLNDFWNTATSYARAQHFAFSDAIGHPAYFVYSSATCCPFSVQNNIHTICSSSEHMIEFSLRFEAQTSYANEQRFLSAISASSSDPEP